MSFNKSAFTDSLREAVQLVLVGADEVERRNSTTFTYCQCCTVKIPAPARIICGVQLCETCHNYWTRNGCHKVECWHTGTLKETGETYRESFQNRS